MDLEPIREVFFRDMLKWLDYDGIAFFEMCVEFQDRVDACWIEREGTVSIPHAVHFNEGMQIRNWIRKWILEHVPNGPKLPTEKNRRIHIACMDLFNSQWLDDHWVPIVTEALKRCKGGQ